jgi:23S rRNA (cytosine1962-C5)-methyltransferase
MKLPSVSDITTALEKALLRRLPLTAGQETYRLVDGKGDGIPTLYIDRYKQVGVAHLLPEREEVLASYEAHFIKVLTAAAPLFIAHGVTTLYLRTHAKDARTQLERPALPLFGERVEELLVTDGAGTYIVKPEGSLHAGLFVDMREVRQRYLTACTGMRVLNLFCFTGSLGIAAALGGAEEIGQVDSSPAVLTWAKRNFEQNFSEHSGQPRPLMKFFCDDCGEFLSREVKRVEKGGRRTDLVIIDPPSFGRGRKKIFSFKKDIGRLVRDILAIMTPQGKILLTTNSRSHTPEDLALLIREEALELGMPLPLITPLVPPTIDFPSQGRDSIAMRGVVATLVA